jgi:hypothetical protein
LRQSAHFQTRRCEADPVRVLRDAPFSGVRKYGVRTEPQCGQTGRNVQRKTDHQRAALAAQTRILAHVGNFSWLNYPRLVLRRRIVERT